MIVIADNILNLFFELFSWYYIVKRSLGYFFNNNYIFFFFPPGLFERFIPVVPTLMY